MNVRELHFSVVVNGEYTYMVLGYPRCLRIRVINEFVVIAVNAEYVCALLSSSLAWTSESS